MPQQIDGSLPPQPEESVSTNTHTRFHKKLISILAVVIMFLLAVIGYAYIQNQKLQDQLKTKIDISPTPLITANPSPTPDTPEEKTFTHTELPSFRLTYTDDWSLVVKEFDMVDNIGFNTNYFPECFTNCMGVRLAKANVSLDLIFNIVFDDGGIKCSTTVGYTKIGSDWYRFKDSERYFYTRHVEFNKTFGQYDVPFPFGTVNDEWSAVQGATYDVCVKGSGPILSETISTEGGTLLEHPYINGTPDTLTLQEIDTIVASMEL